jgi:hypothetical protein
MARAVEQVMQTLGIPRGAGAGAGVSSPSASGSSPSVGQQPSPALADAKAAILPSPAAEIVTRVFASQPAKASNPNLPAAPSPPSSPAHHPPAPSPKVAEFVSESDVRMAVRKSEKIFVGPKTIITPAARDLASSHDILVETKARP